MNYFKLTVGIFIALAASRFIPHPPNFTSLLALSFYIPLFFGRKYIFSILLSFFITDMVIGFHSTTFFTWGSIVIIGLIANWFAINFISRMVGALFGALIFFIITNFGVWSLGGFGYSLEGLLTSYTLAIPFFTYSCLSTLIYSLIIELLYLATNKYLIQKKII
jgi:hypothetical protein